MENKIRSEVVCSWLLKSDFAPGKGSDISSSARVASDASIENAPLSQFTGRWKKKMSRLAVAALWEI
jgi:hypothetical protein